MHQPLCSITTASSVQWITNLSFSKAKRPAQSIIHKIQILCFQLQNLKSSPAYHESTSSHHPNKAGFLYLIEDECDAPSPLPGLSEFLFLKASLPAESHSSFLKQELSYKQSLVWLPGPWLVERGISDAYSSPVCSKMVCIHLVL